MLVTRRYLDVITSIISGKTGVTIKSGDTWECDLSSKILTYKEQDLLSCSPSQAKGYILHEIGHLRYTDPIPNPPNPPYPHLFHDMLNALEDIRIEKCMYRDFGDYAYYPLQSLNSFFFQKKNYSDDTPYTQFREVLGGMYLLAYDSSRLMEYLDLCSPLTKKFIREPYKKSARFLSLQNITHDLLLSTNRGTTDTKYTMKVVTHSLIPVLKPLLDQIKPEDVPKPNTSAGSSTGSGTGGLDSAGSIRKPGKGHILEDDDTESFEPLFIPSDEELDGMLQPYYQTLAHHLSQVLEERKSTKFTGQHLKGKLLSRNAYKVLTDTPRLFSKKTKPDKADFKAILCLDGSGSMHGPGHVNTYIGSYLLKRTFEVMGVDIEYIQFDSRVKHLKELKQYRTPSFNSNDDAGALEMASTLLDHDKDNLVLVLTDGGICTEIQPPLEKLRSQKAKVIAIGIGMRDEELSRYGDYVNVPEVIHLPKVLTNLVKKLVHR